MTNTEKLIFELTKNTCLSLWSYANPIGKKGKELCDILVYSEPNIIIISVKEIIPTDSGNNKVDWERWERTAIEKSYKQIYGAERYLNSLENILLNNGTVELKLPPLQNRKYYRIAVAIGGEEKMPIVWGDFGKGFVHVFDNISVDIIFKELDTITDLLKYLEKKEVLYKNKEKDFVITGGEEDLLAFYLSNNEDFKYQGNTTILDDNLWKGYIASKEYSRWKKNVKVSSLWDNFIELLTKDFQKGRLEVGGNYNDIELVLRTMAKESRNNRILLSKGFLDFYSNPTIRSRPVASYSDIVYVFLTANRDEDREYRRAELMGRCLIVRKYTPEAHIVVGIATEKNDGENGFSLDVTYLYKPSISKRDEKNVEKMVNEFGWFKNSFKGR
ncbi:MAG: hypothetical protein WC595_06950 [Candidatus Nanoarchaeia archaeon]